MNARCINREWFFIPIEESWEIFSDYLFLLNKGFGIEIHCFVLMNNHFHMIVSAPNLNLSEGMNYFMRETSKEIGRASKRINQIYGGPYHKCLIDRYHYFLHAYKYVYRNPVEARLIKNVEDYRFSTLHGLLGLSKIIIPLREDTLLFEDEDLNGHLKWLNTEYNDDHRSQIEMALKKGKFELTGKGSSHRKSILELEKS